MEKDEKETIGTPFDDSWQTLEHLTPRFSIPLGNEMFDLHFSQNAKIIRIDTVLPQIEPDGTISQRRVDNLFDVVEGKMSERIHYECESDPERSILEREFDYDNRAAQREKHFSRTESRLIVKYPLTGIVALRSAAWLKHEVEIVHKGSGWAACDMVRRIAILDVNDYSLEQMFEKELLILVPFYAFHYEKELAESDLAPETVEKILGDMESIRGKLEELQSQEKITAFEKWVLIACTNTVAGSLSRKHGELQEGIQKIMGGHVLTFEARDIHERALEEGLERGLEQGLEDGRREGREDERGQIIARMLQNGFSKDMIRTVVPNVTEKDLESAQEALRGAMKK